MGVADGDDGGGGLLGFTGYFPLVVLYASDRDFPKLPPPLAIVAFPCIQLNRHRRVSHWSVIALIKYPSLMPLYIYCVSLETHKASFSDLYDETSLHYLPGTFLVEQETH